jgi:dipeptidyl aminopeptidase/acylaminoacyl peptidase
MTPSREYVALRSGLIAFGLLALLAAPSFAQRTFTIQDALGIASVSDPQLSPDGEFVVYVVSRIDLEENTSGSRIHGVLFAGGDSRPLTRAGRSASHPRFSPDGSQLAFLSSGAGEKTQIWLLPISGGEAKVLSRLPAGVSSFSWAPDGSALAVVSMDPDPNEAKDGEDPRPVPLVIDRRQFKRDGRGYLDHRRRHIYLVDASSGAHEQKTFGPYDDGSPVFAPDSSEIAFVSVRPPDGGDPDATDNSDIFLIPREAGETSEPVRLTNNPGPDRSPVFSPDGAWIAHTGNRKPELIWYATENLYALNRSTDEVVHVAAGLDRNLSNPRFGADGSAIVALLEDSGNRHLVSFPVSEAATAERLVAGERDVRDLEVMGNRVVAVAATVERPPEVIAWEEGEEPRLLTRENEAHLAEIDLAVVERIAFPSSDGTEIQGFVTKPPGFQEGRRYPTILWIHGGPVSQFSTSFQSTWQLFAANGYLVVAANPRGSSGRGEAFSEAIWADWGNLDYEDVNAAVDHVIERGWADPERLGVGGWSYGGILTNYVITKTTRFHAAVSGSSETEYRAAYGNDHYQLEWELELGLPWENPELYNHLSPISRVQHVTTPTLVLCGEKDWNVPLSQSENLYQSLRRLGVPTQLIIYPGQSHGIRLPSFQKDRYERYVAWFDRFLKSGDAATDESSR